MFTKPASFNESTRHKVLTQLSQASILIAQKERSFTKKNELTHKTEKAAILPRETHLIGDVVTSLRTRLKDEGIDRKVLSEEAKTFYEFLAPAKTFKLLDKATKTYTSTEFTQLKKLPNAIFIFGNNDLRHVGYLGELIISLLENTDETITLFIAGKGGHGTSPGPIFGLSEAATMGQRLKELLPENIRKKVNIILEENSTNSGENIRFVDKIIATHLKPSEYKTLAISSNFCTLLRQAHSVLQQSTQWEEISILRPEWATIADLYFKDSEEAFINLIYALREIGTFLDYTLNYDYMTSRLPPTKEEIAPALKLFIKYFNIFANQQLDANELIEQFDLALQQKQSGSLDVRLKLFLGGQVTELADFFRSMFNLIEKQCMPMLPAKFTVWEQSARLLESKRIFASHNLDAPALRTSLTR